MTFKANVRFCQTFQDLSFQNSFQQVIWGDLLNNSSICVFVVEVCSFFFFFSAQLASIKWFEKSYRFTTFEMHASILTATSSQPQTNPSNLLKVLK